MDPVEDLIEAQDRDPVEDLGENMDLDRDLDQDLVQDRDQNLDQNLDHDLVEDLDQNMDQTQFVVMIYIHTRINVLQIVTVSLSINVLLENVDHHHH